MTSTNATATSHNEARRGGPAASRTSSALVGLGLAAGPLFLGASLLQALLRPGFDLTRNAVSLLSLGHLGWIQDLNFAVVGILSLAGALGVRRALAGSVGGTWIPRLLTVVGVGLAAASVFHPDPSDGFPPGTALNASAVSDWHGVLHQVCGSAAFLALIVACFVLGRRFGRAGERAWAVTSRAAGVLFASARPLSGGHDGPVILFTGVSIGWLTVTAGILHTVRSPGQPAAHSTV
jgi:Protein of unknown function (DUF998)